MKQKNIERVEGFPSKASACRNKDCFWKLYGREDEKLDDLIVKTEI